MGWSAIDAKAAELLEAGREIGEPEDEEIAIAGGSHRSFTGAWFFQHPDVGVFVMDRDIAFKYWALGGPEGAWGWPLIDTVDSLSGRWTFFQLQGSVIVSGTAGVFEAHGLIGEEYLAKDGPDGVLGAPTCDESPAGDGMFNSFEEAGSGIWWHPEVGVRVIRDWAADSAAGFAVANLTGISIQDAVTEQLQVDPHKICLPISLVLSTGAAELFGYLAEAAIARDYCRQLTCTLATDWFDSGGWPNSYFGFLTSHNPWLSVTKKTVAGAVRPDIITDAGVRREWYEVKPESLSGVIAGLRKVRELKAFMSQHGLPYVAGTAYVPTPEIPLGPTFDVGGVDLQPFLCVRREMDGLVTYRFGLRGDLVRLAQSVRLAAAVLAILYALLATGGFRLEMPEGLPGATPMPA